LVLQVIKYVSLHSVYITDVIDVSLVTMHSISDKTGIITNDL